MSKTCHRCGGRMTEGFVLDHTQGGYKQSTWVEGPAEKSVWVGLKLKGRKKIPMTSYRCERCGLVENYTEGR
jgi:hypothetical protein